MPIKERTTGTCLYCGEKFKRERISKKFCKPAHRTAFHRLPERVDNMMQVAYDAIKKIGELRKSHPYIEGNTNYALERIEAYAKWHLNVRSGLRLSKAQQIDT